jgi:hypothetical protein
MEKVKDKFSIHDLYLPTYESKDRPLGRQSDKRKLLHKVW